MYDVREYDFIKYNNKHDTKVISILDKQLN